MSQDSVNAEQERAPWPDWVKSLLKWAAIATAIVGAIATFLVAIGKLGDAYYKACNALGICSATPPPTIPLADSGWVDGGSSPEWFCNPQLDAVRKQFPNLSIEMTILPEQHRSEYAPFKHDLYRYQCTFAAKHK